jgi:hypothetical protein
MSVREAVLAFSQLGRLPDSEASVERIAIHQEHLHRIAAPVTDDEAALLVNCFGPDDCFGLAWSLLHLVETAPNGAPIRVEPTNLDNEWIQRLWQRARSTAETPLVTFWGIDRLQRWSLEDLATAKLPDETVRFLTTVGLPNLDDWSFRFDASKGLPRLASRPSYLVLGHDFEVPICIDERRGGAVILFENQPDRAERYVNVSVRKLAESLVIYQQCRAAVASDDSHAAALIAVTERLLREADPSAFVDVESCWPVIIEQMNDGLL